MPIIVGEGYPTDNLDFSVPTILLKGELEVSVETDAAGVLTVCFSQLEEQAKTRSTDRVQAGQPFRHPVVEGQRYQVHAHLDFPGGHLESEPYEFTATVGTTFVTLRPDTPRDLHPR